MATITDEQLKGIAAQALNLAKQDIAKQQTFGMLLATYYEDEGIHRMHLIEEFFLKHLGKDWLDVPQKKHAAFAVLRDALNLNIPGMMNTNEGSTLFPDAFIFAVSANVYVSTEKLKAKGEKAFEASRNWSREEIRRAVKQGLMEMRDAICSTVQTKERVCTVIQQRNEMGGYEKPDIQLFDQADFSGPLKMYGVKDGDDA